MNPFRPLRHLPPGVPLITRLRLRWHLLRRGELNADKVLGFVGEDAAARFLSSRGYRLLARNVETPEGEADLVMLAPPLAATSDQRALPESYVIVEVKTRRVRPGGAPSDYPPESAVHAVKRRKLAAIARHLGRLNRWDKPTRIDVVAIEWPIEPGESPEIRHWVDAVH